MVHVVNWVISASRVRLRQGGRGKRNITYTNQILSFSLNIVSLSASNWGIPSDIP